MKSRAAVALEAGKPLELVEIDVEGPKAGEVLVKMAATSVCHTDAFTLSGDDPEGIFPCVLGHSCFQRAPGCWAGGRPGPKCMDMHRSK